MGLHLEINWEPVQSLEHCCDMPPSDMLLRNGHCSFPFLGKGSLGNAWYRAYIAVVELWHWEDNKETAVRIQFQVYYDLTVEPENI